MSINMCRFIAIIIMFVISRYIQSFWSDIMGRKPIPMEFKRDTRLAVMLTKTEIALFEKAAERDGSASLSDWVRDALIEKAKAE